MKLDFIPFQFQLSTKDTELCRPADDELSFLHETRESNCAAHNVVQNIIFEAQDKRKCQRALSLSFRVFEGKMLKLDNKTALLYFGSTKFVEHPSSCQHGPRVVYSHVQNAMGNVERFWKGEHEWIKSSRGKR